MMSALSVIVHIISEKGTKKVALNCSGSTNVWEVTQRLSQLLEGKHKRGGDYEGALGTILLRDHRGNRLRPINKISTKKGSYLIAEIVKGVDGMQHDRVTRSTAGANGKSINSEEDLVDMVSFATSKRSPSWRNARSPSPTPQKRKKTNEEDTESLSETPSSSSPSRSRSRGDADDTSTIKTKRKSRNRSRSKNEQTIASDAEQQEGHCAACGAAADDSPTVRLRMKRRFESDQSPTRVNLRLRQRACAVCSGEEKSASTEQARKKHVVDTKQATEKRTASPEKKLKDSDGKSPKEEKLSSSLWNIHLEDNEDTGKQDRSSLNTVPEAWMKSSKKAESAMTARKTQVESTIAKEIAHAKEHSVNTISREQPEDNRRKGGINKHSNKRGTEFLDMDAINKEPIAVNQESGSTKKANKSTEKHAVGKHKGGKTVDTDLTVVDLVCTDSKCPQSTTNKEVDAKAIHKRSGTPGKHFDCQHSEPAVDQKPAAANQAKSVGRIKQTSGKTKNTEFCELVDATGKNCETAISKKTGVAKNDAVVHKNSRETTKKNIEVKSKYFVTSSKGSGEAGSADRKHSEMSVDVKKSTGKVVDKPVDSSAPIDKTAVKSTDKFVDIGRKNSETPIVTVDSSSLATSCGISLTKHKIPVFDKRRPKFIKIIIEAGRVDGANGLCKPNQECGVNTPQDDSFTCIDGIDVDVYSNLDSVPVEIADSKECLKADDHADTNEGEPVLLYIGRNELKHSDLETLEEGEWLNDCVINAYFYLLSEKSPLNIFTHSSFFFFSLYKRGYEGVQRWTKNVDLFAQDLIFIPIHNKSHWTLVVVHIKEGVIEYYNSSTLLAGYPKSMMHIREYLKAEALQRGKAAFSDTSWEMYIIDQIPRQQNMDDCGLFICQYAKKLGLKQKVTFDIETTTQLRQQMLQELLESNIEDH